LSQLFFIIQTIRPKHRSSIAKILEILASV
jgi:hypothetical protein